MEELISLYTLFYGTEPETILPLTGSASNRRYFRLASDAGSCVGVIGLDSQENNAFITLARHFRSKGINVPEVYAVSQDGMCYIQEDLGDSILFSELQKSRRSGEGMSEVEDMLCRTMAALPGIQFEGAKGLDFSICYPQPSFDRTMVMFDLNYFKYCFLKPSGLEFNEMSLQRDFEKFADDLLSCADDMVFMYRDFQSRNVMVKDGVPYFIDFQGGRKGPYMYDVASFVWHARSAYSRKLKDRMLDSYLGALSEYRQTSKEDFVSRLRLFVLFRSLQVLGAYGFRGWSEHKAEFSVCIPQAVAALKELLGGVSCGDAADLQSSYPYLVRTLTDMCELPRFDVKSYEEGRLTVTVTSFSFKKGIPEDPSGNGGGYVFDCRSMHNPGRYEPYKKLTGRDEEVIRFLEEDGEITGFLDHVYGVVDPHVETYSGRGFTSLMVSFGCTGGQHRSVYCAEHLARHIVALYPQVRVRLVHREQNISEEL